MRHRPLPIFLLLVAGLAAQPAVAAEDDGAAGQPASSRWQRRGASSGPERGPVPDDATLQKNGAVIGEIYVQTDDIFDPERPGEDGLLFQIANRLHITTRPAVVEDRLLFAKGDPYDPRVLDETARYLRSLDYLYDASVEPIRYHRGRVDVLVRTRDVWTLSGGAGFEHSGGEGALQFSIKETNLFGTGRFLDLKYSDDVDRSSSRFRFVEQNLFGTHADLRLWYAENSDGHRRIFDLDRPFYALDSRWAATTRLISDERQEKIYHQGEVVNRFYHETTRADLHGGISKGFRNGRARRWLLGYTFERNRFWDGVDTVVEPPPDDPLGGFGPWKPPLFDPLPSGPNKDDSVVPGDRTLSYLWLGFEEVQDRYIEAHNMDQLQRTEDFNLGLELSARVGWSAASLGADRDQAIFSANVRSGWSPVSGKTLLVSGFASGRWGADGHENVRVGGEVRYFLRNFGKHRLHATVRADAAWNLDPEDQLLLGGDNGMRGYPLRFQDGDRRLLVSLEQRFYTNWELFHLINVGAAVFFDAGRAWTAEGPGAGNDLGLLKDAGLGLRMSSSRSANGQMLHLDVAFPLDGDRKTVQWLVMTKKSF